MVCKCIITEPLNDSMIYEKMFFHKSKKYRINKIILLKKIANNIGKVNIEFLRK